MNQATFPLPELLRELNIGTLNAVRFRIVPITDSAIATKSLETIFPLVHLKCLPVVLPALDNDRLNAWSITPESIVALLRMKRDVIIGYFLPSCLPNETVWKISIFEGYGIVQITIVAGHPMAVLPA